MSRITALSYESLSSRRAFLRQAAVAGAGFSLLGWKDRLALQAAELKQQGRACILLWMQGGPSQFETFSPKPGHANGGETKAIKTSVAGIEIAEHFPKMAQQMREAAIIRSMTSKEGAHPRASFLMQTGFLPTASVKYPAFGSIVSQQLHRDKLDLPAFVRIGNGFQNGSSGGLLGVEYDPFVMPSAAKPPVNTTPSTDFSRFDRRLGLLTQLEHDQAKSEVAHEVVEHQKLYQKSARMIRSAQMQAFEIEREPQAVRDGYGSGSFGAGCLLARRLVETGVPFVEVGLGNWDTHFDNFVGCKRLAGQVDQPLAYLIADLKQRGLLDSTLVVWMGEFGRTPRVNPRAGRDHYPKAFNVLLAGGGVRGGQVIGKTDAGGGEITDRPIAVPDLFQSFCKSLKIDPNVENQATNGRPIKVVDGGQPISELFG